VSRNSGSGRIKDCCPCTQIPARNSRRSLRPKLGCRKIRFLLGEFRAGPEVQLNHQPGNSRPPMLFRPWRHAIVIFSFRRRRGRTQRGRRRHQSRDRAGEMLCRHVQKIPETRSPRGSRVAPITSDVPWRRDVGDSEAFVEFVNGASLQGTSRKIAQQRVPTSCNRPAGSPDDPCRCSISK